MCYAKPGPRCSNHVKKDLAKIDKKIAQDPSEKNKEQRRILMRDFDSTPEGQKTLEIFIQRTNDLSATAQDGKEFDASREKIKRLQARHSAGKSLRQQKMAAHDVVHGTPLYRGSKISKAAFAMLPESAVKNYQEMVQQKVSEVASRTEVHSVQDKNIKTLLEYAALNAGSPDSVDQYVKTGRMDTETINLVTRAYQENPHRFKAHQEVSQEINVMNGEVGIAIASRVVGALASGKNIASIVSPKLTKRSGNNPQEEFDRLLREVRSSSRA